MTNLYITRGFEDKWTNFVLHFFRIKESEDLSTLFTKTQLNRPIK